MSVIKLKWGWKRRDALATKMLVDVVLKFLVAGEFTEALGDRAKQQLCEHSKI